MSRPNKKLEEYIYHNEMEKKHRKLKEGIRPQLIGGLAKQKECPIDIIGVDHFATVKLKNRYICNLSTLLDKYPNAWKKYHDEDIIKMIVYPTINYKLKDRKVA